MSGPTGGGRHHHDDPPPARWTAPDETGEWVRPGPGDSGVHDFGPAPGGRRRRHSYDDEVAGHDDRPPYDDRLDDRRSDQYEVGFGERVAFDPLADPPPDYHFDVVPRDRSDGPPTAGSFGRPVARDRSDDRLPRDRSDDRLPRDRFDGPSRDGFDDRLPRDRSDDRLPRDRSDDRLPRDRFDGPSRDGFDGSPPFDRITDPPSDDRQRPAPVEGRSSFGATTSQWAGTPSRSAGTPSPVAAVAGAPMTPASTVAGAAQPTAPTPASGTA